MYIATGNNDLNGNGIFYLLYHCKIMEYNCWSEWNIFLGRYDKLFRLDY